MDIFRRFQCRRNNFESISVAEIILCQFFQMWLRVK